MLSKVDQELWQWREHSHYQVKTYCKIYCSLHFNSFQYFKLTKVTHFLQVFYFSLSQPWWGPSLHRSSDKLLRNNYPAMMLMK